MGRVIINDSSEQELFTAGNPGHMSGDGLTDAELRSVLSEPQDGRGSCSEGA